MTTICPLERTCALCGTVGNQVALASTNSFGPSDLDTRPAEMLRSTLPYWIERCPACGFCAPKVSDPVKGAAGIVRTPVYQAQLRDPAVPALAGSFLCYAMILEPLGRFEEAGWAVVHAAWACDDDGSPAASRCRVRAVSLFRSARAQGMSIAQQIGGDEAILADLLRRSGQDGEALAACQEGLALDPEPLVATILRFQRVLVERADREAHTVSEAMAAAGKTGFEFSR